VLKDQRGVDYFLWKMMLTGVYMYSVVKLLVTGFIL